MTSTGRPARRRFREEDIVLPIPVVEAADTVWRHGAVRVGRRAIPKETAVAATYDGATRAMMMATPSDL